LVANIAFIIGEEALIADGFRKAVSTVSKANIWLSLPAKSALSIFFITKKNLGTGL
jgi:hypothetical protein